MSERRWTQISAGSWQLETPVGMASLIFTEGLTPWLAQIEADEGMRQSQPFAMREEAESWVAQQSESVQRESDIAPAVD